MCALELYERWAPTYTPAAHNPLMRVEQAAMLEAWPEVSQRRAVDLACGTGRYAQLLKQSGAAHVVGVDFCGAMLSHATGMARIQADMTRLPFVSGAFDVAICALAVGHVTLDAWAREVARVLDSCGVLLYSDFHPEAARAGLTRSFRDAQDRKWTLPHHRYELAQHEAALCAARLEPDVIRELRVGRELNDTFEGGKRFCRAWHGLPLVLIVRARKQRV
jgi:ubiquinone/menaquinone biosynthesis C-methylase UbiE